MFRQEKVLELVDLIYSAAGDPAKWTEVLTGLAQTLQGSTATAHHEDLGSLESSFSASWNIDPAALEQYTQYYGALNVWFTHSPELRLLLPHLQRAFQLHAKIQGLEQKGDVVADALDQLQHGIVLLDTNGRVLLVNRAASALFTTETALKLTQRGLHAAASSEKRQLSRLIESATATGNGKGLGAGGVLSISRSGLRRPLQVLVTPLRTKAISSGKTVPVVAIFISDPDRQSVSDPAVFAQLFGLTPAEARLAQVLSEGENLRDAADRLRVAQSTLRSQLKSIFAKTNTKRQSELVRLVLLTPVRIARRERWPVRTEGIDARRSRRTAACPLRGRS